MEANTFWKNYRIAHEWQKRHSIRWWKTQCQALEHENCVLREIIKNVSRRNCDNYSVNLSQNNVQSNIRNTESDDEDNQEIDLFEFDLNDDMLDFLTQSVQHKIALKKGELMSAKSADGASESVDKCKPAWINQMNGKLYGEGSSRVLAMEAALGVTAERHLVKSKPSYWPNIPLKL